MSTEKASATDHGEKTMNDQQTQSEEPALNREGGSGSSCNDLLSAEYRGFKIKYDPPPIPLRTHDFQFAHTDYDGPSDHRCGTGCSVADCKAQIDEMIDELSSPTLSEWLGGWEAAVESGQSHISRQEAIRRWERECGQSR